MNSTNNKKIGKRSMKEKLALSVSNTLKRKADVSLVECWNIFIYEPIIPKELLIKKHKA